MLPTDFTPLVAAALALPVGVALGRYYQNRAVGFLSERLRESSISIGGLTADKLTLEMQVAGFEREDELRHRRASAGVRKGHETKRRNREAFLAGYAHRDEVAPGTALVADGGFTCLKAGAKRIVQSAADGTLFIRCADGRHGLAGQLEGDRFVGLKLAEG
jgi:hypothetical protein